MAVTGCDATSPHLLVPRTSLPYINELAGNNLEARDGAVAFAGCSATSPHFPTLPELVGEDLEARDGSVAQRPPGPERHPAAHPDRGFTRVKSLSLLDMLMPSRLTSDQRVPSHPDRSQIEG